MTSSDQTEDKVELDPSKVKLTIDGIEVVVNKGELLIEAAAKAGKFVPRFCYHPRMEPVGVCRMCLVEVDSPRGPSLQPSCYVPADNGMVVNTQSEAVKKAQNGVLEYLLINHPLDCPVCDKGGECPLQDQTVAYGPGESRFIEEKRHFAKPIAISQLVELDRERCIQCSRCTRFSEEIAGEAEIDFLGRGDRTEVAIFPSQPFDSYFSGNTVQICPVGALTAKPYRFKSRPWDLEQVESTCTSCSVGCRVAAQSSANQVVRYLGIDVDEINQSWLCDRGRFGFESIYSANRLQAPMMTISGYLQDVSWAQAIEKVAEVFAEHQLKGADKIGIIGGSRLTNESAYAYTKLFKGLIGTDNVDAAPFNLGSINSLYGLKTATINEVAESDLIITIGSNLKETAPILFLRIRDAILKREAKLVEVGPYSTPLSEYATHVNVNFSNFSEVISSLLNGDSGSENKQITLAAELLKSVAQTADANVSVAIVYSSIDANRPLDNLEAALSKLATFFSSVTVRYLPVLSKPNAMGALDMGMYPNLLPGRSVLSSAKLLKEVGWEKLPTKAGVDATNLLEMAAASKLDTLVLIGTDILTDFYDLELAEKAVANVKNLICIDTHINSTNAKATCVLPALYDAERSGSFTNMEGRVSKIASKVTGPSLAVDDWAIAVQIADSMGEDMGFESLEEIQDEISQVAPAYFGFSKGLNALGESGVVVPMGSKPVSIERRPHDPIEVPGIASTNHQGTPLYAGAVIPSEYSDENTFKVGSVSMSNFRLVAEFKEITLEPKSAVSGGTSGDDNNSNSRPADIDRNICEMVVVESLMDDGTLIKSAATLSEIKTDNVAKISPSLANSVGCHAGDSIKLKLGSAEAEFDVVVDSGVAENTVIVKKLDASKVLYGSNGLLVEVKK